MKIGDRVGVIIGSNESTKVVDFCGYGAYAGDEVPDEFASGQMAEGLRQVGAKNPKLKLDDGTVAWGCETWWGPEATVQRNLKAYEDHGYTINRITIDEYRLNWLKVVDEEMGKSFPNGLPEEVSS